MPTFLLIHVASSLIGIAAGFVVLCGLLTAKRLAGWTMLFLTTTVATSLSGYALPAKHLMPSHIVGAISLVVLAVAIFARYGRHMIGGWRLAYVVSAIVALYLNVFVGVVQSFLKVPTLRELAPTQSEPPFVITQVIVMALFVVLAILAARKFRPNTAPAAAGAGAAKL